MNNTETTSNNHLTKDDYNSIPVYYCKHCGSLAIMTMPGLLDDYCDKCGSTDIGKASIESWQYLQQTVFNPRKLEDEKRKPKINIFK